MQGKSSCEEYYFQDEYEAFLLRRQNMLANSYGALQTKADQMDSYSAPAAIDVGAQNMPLLVGPKRTPATGMVTNKPTFFWLKVISAQMVLLNLLMLVLVIIVVSR